MKSNKSLRGRKRSSRNVKRSKNIYRKKRTNQRRTNRRNNRRKKRGGLSTSLPPSQMIPSAAADAGRAKSENWYDIFNQNMNSVMRMVGDAEISPDISKLFSEGVAEQMGALSYSQIVEFKKKCEAKLNFIKRLCSTNVDEDFQKGVSERIFEDLNIKINVSDIGNIASCLLQAISSHKLPDGIDVAKFQALIIEELKESSGSKVGSGRRNITRRRRFYMKGGYEDPCSSETCSICHEVVREEDEEGGGSRPENVHREATAPGYRHCFHKECLENWFRINYVARRQRLDQLRAYCIEMADENHDLNQEIATETAEHDAWFALARVRCAPTDVTGLQEVMSECRRRQQLLDEKRRRAELQLRHLINFDREARELRAPGCILCNRDVSSNIRRPWIDAQPGSINDVGQPVEPPLISVLETREQEWIAGHRPGGHPQLPVVLVQDEHLRIHLIQDELPPQRPVDDRTSVHIRLIRDFMLGVARILRVFADRARIVRRPGLGPLAGQVALGVAGAQVMDHNLNLFIMIVVGFIICTQIVIPHLRR